MEDNTLTSAILKSLPYLFCCFFTKSSDKNKQ